MKTKSYAWRHGDGLWAFWLVVLIVLSIFSLGVAGAMLYDIASML